MVMVIIMKLVSLFEGQVILQSHNRSTLLCLRLIHLLRFLSEWDLFLDRHRKQPEKNDLVNNYWIFYLILLTVSVRTFSVIIVFTQFFPVSGKLHWGNILWLPSLAACSIVTTTLVPGAETRSIAPPMPLTSFPWKQLNENITNKKQYVNLNVTRETHRNHPVSQIAVLGNFHST